MIKIIKHLVIILLITLIHSKSFGVSNEILKVGNLNDGIQKEISRRDLAKVIETHLSLLFRECLRIVQDGGFDEKIPAGFGFTGGTSNLEGIQDLGREIMQKNVKHKITCIGDKPGIRFAITKPDVDHIYED